MGWLVAFWGQVAELVIAVLDPPLFCSVTIERNLHGYTGHSEEAAG